MTVSKRLMDLAIAIFLTVIVLPVGLIIALAIWALDGRPILYRAERMRSVDRGFQLWKFRTMKPDSGDSGVSGGDKASRITRTGKVLRRYRLDEVPQIVNVLRGDISFVGPRPPLRRYVEMFPELYGAVLKNRPGITGLATLAYHKHEEAMLAQCTTAEETEAVYVRRCVPAKARLDLIWAANRTLCFDLWLMLVTAFRRLPLRFRNGSGQEHAEDGQKS